MELCEIRTAEQAIEAYSERFGGWPYFLMMDASDHDIIFKARKALRTDTEIVADYDEADY